MELRVDPNITSADSTATMQDIYSLHNAEANSDVGSGITVAVMDTGVDDTHPVFEGTTVEHHDFTGNGPGDAVGHGTATAGLVAQLAPGAKIVSLRIFGDSGKTSMKPIAKAYDWLVQNADSVDVCNFSWGARSNVPALNELHRKAKAAGVQDVVAAGNTGKRGGSPATAKGAFSVGALTQEGALTRFSSYNPQRDNPDVSAIGKDVKLPRASGTSTGTVVDENYVKASGTSFSAPITAGFVARYLTQYEGGVLQAFESSARDIEGTPEDGQGIVDYGRATSRQKTTSTADAIAFDFLGKDVVQLGADWLETGSYQAIRNPDGSVRLVPRTEN